MLSIHSRREIPGVFGIKCIADDDLPGSIGSALLEVVTIGNAVIIVARTARPLGTVWRFTIDSNWIPVESLHDDLFVFGGL